MPQAQNVFEAIATWTAIQEDALLTFLAGAGAHGARSDIRAMEVARSAGLVPCCPYRLIQGETFWSSASEAPDELDRADKTLARRLDSKSHLAITTHDVLQVFRERGISITDTLARSRLRASGRDEVSPEAFTDTDAERSLSRLIATLLLFAGPLTPRDLFEALSRDPHNYRLTEEDVDRELKVNPMFLNDGSRWRAMENAPIVTPLPAEVRLFHILRKARSKRAIELVDEMETFGVSRATTRSILRTSPLLREWPGGLHSPLGGRPDPKTFE